MTVAGRLLDKLLVAFVRRPVVARSRRGRSSVATDRQGRLELQHVLRVLDAGFRPGRLSGIRNWRRRRAGTALRCLALLEARVVVVVDFAVPLAGRMLFGLISYRGGGSRAVAAGHRGGRQRHFEWLLQYIGGDGGR